MKIVFATLLLFGCVSAKAQSLTPGLWQTKTEVVLNGLTLPNPNSTECFSPAETRNVKARITKELRGKGCSLTSWIVRGSAVTASVACENQTFRANGTLSGQFTEKSYDLHGTAQGTIGFIPATAQVALRGTWLKACSQ